MGSGWGGGGSGVRGVYTHSVPPARVPVGTPWRLLGRLQRRLRDRLPDPWPLPAHRGWLAHFDPGSSVLFRTALVAVFWEAGNPHGASQQGKVVGEGSGFEDGADNSLLI
ncbi:hypothetical protein chiPu_0025347 [Chiloscyllium punctatum]|uniref:Uncharacterized protein n=1 Tax=Chiloscyllium punctatum TaxID=137246 RepID=A0A401TF39_CHIPU|nr:hypothetical protein [Chiloscyllium punctatum]